MRVQDWNTFDSCLFERLDGNAVCGVVGRWFEAEKAAEKEAEKEDGRTAPNSLESLGKLSEAQSPSDGVARPCTDNARCPRGRRHHRIIEEQGAFSVSAS